MTRYRSMGGIGPAAPVYETFTYNSEVTTTEIGSVPDTGGSFKEMIDTIIPSFRKRVARGEVFFNPMTSSLKERVRSSNGYKVHNIDQPPIYESNSDCSHLFMSDHYVNLDRDSMSIISSSDVEQAMSQSATACRANRGNLIKSNSWESLAEMGKTVEMLRSPINAFIDFDKKFKIRAFRSIAKAWLAYRYGIKPLLMNIDEVTKRLQKQAEKVIARNSTRDSLRLHANDTVIKTDGARGMFLYTVTTKRRHDVSIRSLSMDEVRVDRLSEMGLSSKQLLQLPWELVPYSFVVDWFINAGDVIGAVLPSVGWKQLGGCQVIREELQWHTEMSSSRLDPYYGYYYVADRLPTASVLSKVKITRRIPLPGASLVIKSDFRLSSFTRVADALALITQLISSKFSKH